MNFFINANGNIIAVNPSTVNQGTAEVSVIRLFAPIPISSVVTCSYKLPNGVWGVPVKMTAVTTLEDVLSKTNTMTDGMDSFSSFSVWEWSIEDTMTQFFGTVEVQFFCHFGGVGNDYPRLASDIASFSVRKGVPTYIPPINAEDLEFEKLLNAILSALQELQQADAQGAFLSQQYANQALEHAENALVSERNAEQSELNAEKAKEAALGYSYNAKAHANNALIAKTHAAVSADDAKTAEENAETAKGDAETAKNAAVAAREAAEIFSATAQTHANNASTDATAAADSATAAQEAAKEAKIYAIRAEETLEGVGNFIPGELGEDGKFYPFDKDTGQVSTSALAAPSAGVVYFDLFSNKLYTWDSATGSYILQADLNATGGGGSLDPSVLAEYVKFTDMQNLATPKPSDSWSTAYGGGTIAVLVNGEWKKMAISGGYGAYNIAMRQENGVLNVGTPTADSHATPRKYVDGLQKFTHYITIGTTDEHYIINVSLRITNNDNTSLAIKEEDWYNFSLLAQAISDTANGAISANGMIRNADTITHLVLRAISSDGSSLKLETYNLVDQSLEYIEISGEQYVLIDNVI